MRGGKRRIRRQDGENSELVKVRMGGPEAIPEEVRDMKREENDVIIERRKEEGCMRGTRLRLWVFRIVPQYESHVSVPSELTRGPKKIRGSVRNEKRCGHRRRMRKCNRGILLP